MQYPWIEIKERIKKLWITIEDFWKIIWKSKSKMSQIINWKIPITFKWSCLLWKYLWCDFQYFANKYNDYLYSHMSGEERRKEDIKVIVNKIKNERSKKIKDRAKKAFKNQLIRQYRNIKKLTKEEIDEIIDDLQSNIK